METKTKRLLNSLLRSSEYPSETDDYEEVTEVTLDTLSATPHLLIKTAYSTYRFSVNDPKQKGGRLIGGAFGETGVAALLLGAKGKAEYGTETYIPKLTKGARAVFLLERDATRIVTSAIRRLIHLKAIDNSPNAWLQSEGTQEERL